ncbi:putative ATP-grasp-modified RiPP [Streptomyces roseirectus]|uniref:Putative ATP-grasp-modified RiPP n=1 Tax=Streptomyces roseirectus TaxID=2768066 RepID=A0A7H0ICE7_9ACTN|nr:putative ATP-grasp-modified RiPP [Streptomyces roseirectus]QNP70463.1 putative ATP-grasp-modified RiPP [Streptomyces roseirectus]
MAEALKGQRPYALSGARFRPASENPVLSAPVYDPRTQTARLADGVPLTSMATSQKTNPDGDVKNPPPSDEGADPGAFE